MYFNLSLNARFFISACLVFFVVFSVKFVFLPFSTLVMIFSLSLVLFFVKALVSEKLIINKYYFYFYALALVQLFFYFISYFFSDSTETSQVIVFFIFFVALPIIANCLLYVLRDVSDLKSVVIRVFMLAIFMQAFLSVIISFNPAFQVLLYSLIDVDLERLMVSANSRLVGFGTSYFQLGTIMVLGFFLSIYSFKATELSSTYRNIYLLFISSIFLLVGFFAARTTIVGVVIVLMFYILFDRGGFFKVSKRKLFSIVLFVFVFLFVALIAILLLSDNIILSSFLTNSLPWAAEIFINAFSGEGLSSASTSELGSMYFLPDNFKTFILGDARVFSDSGYYMATDAGYIRQIFSYGLVGVIISLSVYTYVFYVISKSFGVVFSLCLATLVFVFNIKGIFIYYSNYEFFIVTCFVISILESGQDHEKPLCDGA